MAADYTIFVGFAIAWAFGFFLGRRTTWLWKYLKPKDWPTS